MTDPRELTRQALDKSRELKVRPVEPPDGVHVLDRTRDGYRCLFHDLAFIVSDVLEQDGRWWLHGSVSRRNRTIPTWTDVHELRTRTMPDRQALQVFAAADQHVDVGSQLPHPIQVLHLWSPEPGSLELPVCGEFDRTARLHETDGCWVQELAEESAGRPWIRYVVRRFVKGQDRPPLPSYRNLRAVKDQVIGPDVSAFQVFPRGKSDPAHPSLSLWVAAPGSDWDLPDFLHGLKSI